MKNNEIKVGDLVAFAHNPTRSYKVLKTEVCEAFGNDTMVELGGMGGRFNVSILKKIKR